MHPLEAVGIHSHGHVTHGLGTLKCAKIACLQTLSMLDTNWLLRHHKLLVSRLAELIRCLFHEGISSVTCTVLLVHHLKPLLHDT